MRLNLKVPFAEKDEAKKLGARWDPARKLWYIENKEDLAPFSRWSPSPHDTAAETAQPQKRASVARQASSGFVHVGSKYVEHPRVCDCPPWEVCDACRSMALPEHAGDRR